MEGGISEWFSEYFLDLGVTWKIIKHNSSRKKNILNDLEQHKYESQYKSQ